MTPTHSNETDDFVDYELGVVENDGNEHRIKCESGVARRKEKGVNLSYRPKIIKVLIVICLCSCSNDSFEDMTRYQEEIDDFYDILSEGYSGTAAHGNSNVDCKYNGKLFTITFTAIGEMKCELEDVVGSCEKATVADMPLYGELVIGTDMKIDMEGTLSLWSRHDQVDMSLGSSMGDLQPKRELIHPLKDSVIDSFVLTVKEKDDEVWNSCELKVQ
jgi:hypothetical protein